MIHFSFECLSQTHKFCHGLPLELFYVLVLLFQLWVCIVAECAQFQRLVSSFIVNLLLKVVLAVINFLANKLFAFNACINLRVKSRLQLVKSFFGLVNFGVRFCNSVVNFLRNCCLKPIQSFLGIFELSSVWFAHLIYLPFKLFSQHSQFVFKARPERLEGIIYSLGFCFGKVAICLYFSLDVLKFGL